MTISGVILWSERLLGFALLLQMAELIFTRRNFSASGIWDWNVLQRDYPRSLRRGFSCLLSNQSFPILLELLMLYALLLAWHPSWLGNWVLVSLLTGYLLVCWRFRGTYNGGSDFMTVVVLIGLTGAALFPSAAKFFLAYIAVQVCLSYFISGAVKLRKSKWRSGRALQSLSRTSIYPIPDFARLIMNNPRVSRILSIVLIAFECSFPLALLSTEVCRVYLAIAVIFHLAMVYVFGLNRFLWAWLSAYPALYFWSGR